MLRIALTLTSFFILIPLLKWGSERVDLVPRCLFQILPNIFYYVVSIRIFSFAIFFAYIFSIFNMIDNSYDDQVLAYILCTLLHIIWLVEQKEKKELSPLLGYTLLLLIHPKIVIPVYWQP